MNVDIVITYASRFVDTMYDLHLLEAVTNVEPIIIWLMGIVLGLLLYTYIGTAVSQRRMRSQMRDMIGNSDRLSRDLAREKRIRLGISEKYQTVVSTGESLEEDIHRLRFENDALLSFQPGQAWFIDGNAKFIKATGLELGERISDPEIVQGKTLVEVFGESVNDLQHLVVKAVNTKQPLLGHVFEAYQIDHPVHYTFDMHPVFDEEHRFRCLLVMVYDSSSINELRNRGEQMLQRTQDGILIIQNNIIQYANTQMETLAGAGHDELTGQTFDSLFDSNKTKPWKPSEDEDVWNPMNLRLFSSMLQRDGKKTRCVIYTIGHTRWDGAEADLLFVCDREGNTLTEQRRQESVTVLNTMLDAIDQGVVVIDHEGKISHYNQRLLDMWDLSEAIFTVKKWDSVSNSMKTKVSNPQEYKAWLQRNSAGEPVGSIELSLKNGNVLVGCERQYSLGDGFTGRVISFIDVSGSMKREAELKKALDQAEVATQTKSEFLARMSHDIRTPMNGIIGVVTLMEQTQLNHRQHRYMDVIQASADSLLNLINDILDFSKIEAGYLKLEKIDFDLIETIGSVTSLLALKAQSKGIELLTFVRPSVPTFFRGDPNRLRQILINLGNNAIKFTKTGQVVIHCEVENTSKGKCMLHFTVSDTGVGIKPDKLDTIFESYEQEDVSTARNYGGTGLGLSICKHLVDLMHGRIWVESEYGKGADFHFTLRMNQLEDNDLERDIELFEKRKPRILIAVRNDVTKQFISETLRYYGIACTVIEMPELVIDALKAAAQAKEDFDLLLMEPFEDAYADIARALSTDRKLMRVHLILLVSFAESSTLVVPDDVVVSEMINLPLKRADLLLTIKRELGLVQKNETPVVLPLTGGGASAVTESYRILLAEDNPINLGIVTEILESEGHAVVQAGNGEEVLRQMDEHEFDVVFMDIHMPLLDGFEATSAIREKEKDGHHQIIIAMTADVLSDDRDKCLAAGMDGFITKPLKLDDLRLVLHRVMSAERGEAAVMKETESVAANVLDIRIDLAHVRETLGDNVKVIAKTFELIYKKFPRSQQEIEQALKDEDTESIHRAAHGMKGFMNYFDIPDMTELVVDMENAGKNGDIKRARQLFIDLEPYIEAFLAALNNARKEL
ncbi:MAG: response regulator [Candidatus Cloacimonetes bacterium]|nr:response regulator [Candidatus Cloacimonadota bacterium]